ncbi:EAL domain-containing protein [Methylomonas methanica]
MAEGVEQPGQELILRKMGCTFGQGYLYAKPMSHNKLLEFMRPAALAETL